MSLLIKAHVKQHMRATKTGKVGVVHDFERKDQPRQMSLFGEDTQEAVRTIQDEPKPDYVDPSDFLKQKFGNWIVVKRKTGRTDKKEISQKEYHEGLREWVNKIEKEFDSGRSIPDEGEKRVFESQKRLLKNWDEIEAGKQRRETELSESVSEKELAERRAVIGKDIEVIVDGQKRKGIFSGAKGKFAQLRLLDDADIDGIEYAWDTAKRIAGRGTVKLEAKDFRNYKPLDAKPASDSAKEPWMMTRDEHLATTGMPRNLIEKIDSASDIMSDKKYYSKSNGKRASHGDWRELRDAGLATIEPDPVRSGDMYMLTEKAKNIATGHRRAVVAALSAGKPVPAEVLKDYPDLKPKAEKNPAKVASGIMDQIGQKAFAMMGATNYAHSDDGEGALTFKVGKNPKNISHVKVTLMPDDTYSVDYYSGSGTKFEKSHEAKGLMGEDLTANIERNTGLRMSLGGDSPVSEAVKTIEAEPKKSGLSERALSIMAAAHYDAWNLAGPHNKKLRQELYSELIGRKATVAESGVAAIRSALNERYCPEGNCQATRDDNLRDKMKAERGTF